MLFSLLLSFVSWLFDERQADMIWLRRMVIVAAYCLSIAHPGPVFGWPKNEASGPEDLGVNSSRKTESA